MIEFRPVADAAVTDPPTLRVSWARLPMLWWRDVPVVQLEPVELNELDVFVVEATARLGRLPAATFSELTGLSDLVFSTLGRRLQALDLVRWDDAALVPAEASTLALGEATAQRRTTTTLDFLYLPETDDLLAVEEGLSDFERATPRITSVAPLPLGLHDVTLREFLTSRIEARRIANLASSIVAVAPEAEADEPLTAMAGADPAPPVPVVPAIEVAATIVLDGDWPRAVLEVAPRTKRRGQERGDGGAEPAAMVDITGAAGCVDAWRRVCDVVAKREHRGAVMHAVAPQLTGYAVLEDDGPGRWSLPVTGAQAEELARSQPLTRPLGLEVRDEHAHVRTVVRFVPADAAAEQLFALDALVQLLLAAPQDVVAVLDEEAEAVARAGGRDAVRDRAWALGHHWIVHALREDQDFAYA